MKAISFAQPWASLVAHGEKQFDTRTIGTEYRGPIAIHALPTRTDSDRQTATNQPFATILDKRGLKHDDLPLGQIIAIAELVDVHESYKQVFKIGRQERKLSSPHHSHPHMLQFANVQLLESPIIVTKEPRAGYSGIWEWDEASFVERAPEPAPEEETPKRKTKRAEPEAQSE